MFPGEKLLRQIVTAAIGIFACAGKMMIDAQSRGPTKIIRERKNLIGWFAVIDFRLCERTSHADREKLRRDSAEAREQ